MPLGHALEGLGPEACDAARAAGAHAADPALPRPARDRRARCGEPGAGGADSLPVTCPGTEACPAVPPRQSEKEQLLQAMERSGWVQAKAARLLNLTPRQVGYALRKYDIDIKRF